MCGVLSLTISPPGVSWRAQDSSLCSVWGALSMLHRKVEDLESGVPRSTQRECLRKGVWLLGLWGQRCNSQAR